MSQAILDHVGSFSIKKKVPVLKAGYTVRVHQRITEGSKERVQVFEGLVIRIGSGASVNKTFTVRKIVDGVGVEKLFPFFAPSIEKIEIVKSGKVRRSKLYYMRNRTGKSARLRERGLGDIALAGSEPTPEPEPEVEEAAEETPAPEAPKEEEAAAPAEEPKAEEVKEEEEKTEE